MAFAPRLAPFLSFTRCWAGWSRSERGGPLGRWSRTQPNILISYSMTGGMQGAELTRAPAAVAASHGGLPGYMVTSWPVRIAWRRRFRVYALTAMPWARGSSLSGCLTRGGSALTCRLLAIEGYCTDCRRSRSSIFAPTPAAALKRPATVSRSGPRSNSGNLGAPYSASASAGVWISGELSLPSNTLSVFPLRAAVLVLCSRNRD